MSRALIALSAVGWLNTHALGGLANFSPSAVEVTPGTPVVMEITLQATGVVTMITDGDILIVSNDVDFLFAYSDDFLAAMQYVSPICAGEIYVPGQCLVGGSNTTVGAGTTLSLGRITVDTSSLPNGTYHIAVDSGIDGFSGIFRGLPGQPFVSESLSGGGTITVVIPEPATLSLLGIGLLGLIHRRLRY